MNGVAHKHRLPRPRRRRALGQAMTEYVLVVGILSFFLFIPTPILESPNTGEPRSIFTLFIDAFDVYIDSYHTVIILPIP